MPMSITTGLSKKVGTANYGSVGATCNVTFEADHGLIDSDLAGFHRKVQNAFVAVRQAVHDELAREQGHNATNAMQNGDGDDPVSQSSANTNVNTTTGQSNGHHNGNGNGRSNGRKATASQIRAIHAIINRRGLDLVETLRDRFGVEMAEELSIGQASALIDELKGAINGAGGRR